MTDIDTESAPTGAEPFRPHAGGVPYKKFIAALSSELGAKTYLEVGTRTGASLAEVDCDSIAIDPAFALSSDVVGRKRVCLMFQLTSDEFFARYGVRDFFPNGVDLAFLDGMHRFEYLLRDFINAEQSCRRNSIIVMHDCLPPTPSIALRRARADPTMSAEATTKSVETGRRGWWAGDVWKIVPILHRYRPELAVHCLDCPPTGLVLVTDLDPQSRVLDESYYQIISEFGSAELAPKWFDEFYDSIDLKNSREFLRPENLTLHVWL